MPTRMGQLFLLAGGGLPWVACTMPKPFVLHSQAGPWALGTLGILMCMFSTSKQRGVLKVSSPPFGELSF